MALTRQFYTRLCSVAGVSESKFRKVGDLLALRNRDALLIERPGLPREEFRGKTLGCWAILLLVLFCCQACVSSRGNTRFPFRAIAIARKFSSDALLSPFNREFFFATAPHPGWLRGA